MHISNIFITLKSTDKQRGWWRISDSEQLKSLIVALNVRGIREKNLQKLLEKNFNFICQTSFKPKRNSEETVIHLGIILVDNYFSFNLLFNVIRFIIVFVNSVNL